MSGRRAMPPGRAAEARAFHAASRPAPQAKRRAAAVRDTLEGLSDAIAEGNRE